LFFPHVVSLAQAGLAKKAFRLLHFLLAINLFIGYTKALIVLIARPRRFYGLDAEAMSLPGKELVSDGKADVGNSEW
jgi:hypothetical protein